VVAARIDEGRWDFRYKSVVEVFSYMMMKDVVETGVVVIRRGGKASRRGRIMKGTSLRQGRKRAVRAAVLRKCRIQGVFLVELWTNSRTLLETPAKVGEGLNSRICRQRVKRLAKRKRARVDISQDRELSPICVRVQKTFRVWTFSSEPIRRSDTNPHLA